MCTKGVFVKLHYFITYYLLASTTYYEWFLLCFGSHLPHSYTVSLVVMGAFCGALPKLNSTEYAALNNAMCVLFSSIVERTVNGVFGKG